MAIVSITFVFVRNFFRVRQQQQIDLLPAAATAAATTSFCVKFALAFPPLTSSFSPLLAVNQL